MAIKSNELSRGPDWLQDAFNDLRDDVIANRPVAGNGIQINETDEGALIKATAKSGKDSGTQPMYFIDGGVLKTGDFAVSNIAEV